MNWKRFAAIICFLLLFSFLVVKGIYENSACYDEGVHLAAGAAVWDEGWNEFSDSHPSPVLAYLTFPLWDQVKKWPEKKPSSVYNLSHRLVTENRSSYLTWLRECRFMVLAVGLLMALLVYHIAQSLWSTGLGALALYSVSPVMISFSGIIGADFILAFLMLATLWACRYFWQHSRGVWFVSLFWGLALATKYTAIILMIPIIFVVVLKKRWWALVFIPFGAWLVLSSLYAWETPITYLSEHTWRSGFITSLAELLMSLPLPLPHDYVVVLDKLSSDIEALGPQWFNGSWHNEHAFFYFPLAILLKLPFVISLMLFWEVWKIRSLSWSYLALLDFVFLYWVFLLISDAQMLGIRFFLIFWPVLFIGLSQLSKGRDAKVFWCLFFIIACQTFSHGGDQLGRTSLFAGDCPEQVIADSAVDWGQDLIRLSEKQPEVGLHVFPWSLIAADLYDIKILRRPLMKGDWVAVSRNYFLGDGRQRSPGSLLPPGIDFNKMLTDAEMIQTVGHGMILFKLKSE